MDTLSVSLPIDSAMHVSVNSDLTDSQQTVNISSQILQSPNIDPSSGMDMSNELIINGWVGLHQTTFSTPSIKHRFSFTDSSDTQYHCALAHWSRWVALTTPTHWQVLLMKSLYIIYIHIEPISGGRNLSIENLSTFRDAVWMGYGFSQSNLGFPQPIY